MPPEEKKAKQAAYARAWYEKNRAAVISRSKKWAEDNRERRREIACKWVLRNLAQATANSVAWKAANPDKANRWARSWYAKNQAKVRAMATGWRRKNHDHVLRRSAAYREKNREMFRVFYRKRRFAKATGGSHTAADVAILIRIQRGLCVYCKTDVTKRRHVDHIMPLALGGSNDRSNLQILCVPCNLRKNRSHPIDFAQRMGFLL